MESKKANLIIDIAKNIVEQYREQLSKSIEESKQKDLEKYSFEKNNLEMSEKCLELVDQILNNFELSVFNGTITDDFTIEHIYINGYEDSSHTYNEKPTKFNKEKREIVEAEAGVIRIFRNLGIPEHAIYPIVADLISRYREEEYMDYGQINEDIVRKRNKRFNANGIYVVGKLKINNTLGTSVDVNGGFLINRMDAYEPVIYSLYKDLVLESSSIKNIVDKYIEEEIKSNSITKLDDQNELIHNILNSLITVGNNGGGLSDDESLYYYDYFKSLFQYNFSGGKNYLINPISINTKLDGDSKENDFLTNIDEKIKELQSVNSRKKERVRLLKDLLITIKTLQQENSELDEQIDELMSKLNRKILR